MSFGEVSEGRVLVFCETRDFLKLPRGGSGMRVSVCISFRRGSFGCGSFWLDKFRVSGVGTWTPEVVALLPRSSFGHSKTIFCGPLTPIALPPDEGGAGTKGGPYRTPRMSDFHEINI